MKKIIPIALLLAALTGCGGSDQRKEKLQGTFMTLGMCIEFNDTITRRIAEINARGLTTGNDTYFVLNNAQSESERLRRLSRSITAQYASELHRLGISANSELAKGRSEATGAFRLVLTTGDRNSFNAVVNACNSLH